MIYIIRITEVARFLYRSDAIWRALVLLRAFFDEVPRGPFGFVIAGYVGKEEIWKSVESDFLGLLGECREAGVKTFHLTDCLAQEGEFARLEKPFINRLLHKLSEIVGREGLQAIFSSVILDDWDEVATDAEE